MFSLPLRVHVVLEPRAHRSATEPSHASSSSQPNPTSLVLGLMLAVSEALPLTTRVKANGILDAVRQLLDYAHQTTARVEESHDPLSLALLPLPKL